ncbi:MAG: LCP family protein [Lachnospiraceae bacterium]|nr:LCP family protein [Lachnospiraceae bacterium]
MAKNKHSKKRKKRGGLIALTVVLALLAVLLGGVFFVFQNYYGLSNYVSDSAARATAAAAEVSSDVLAEADATGLTESEATGLQGLFQDLKNFTVNTTGDNYNLLLIGIDRRDKSWNGNSDSMILVSINKSSKTIHMMSFMRDLYAYIEGHGVRKLNAACAYGGPTLLVDTIESNYKVDIDNYACVDFMDLANIIDILGGVDLEVSAEEASLANGYIDDMAASNGIDSTGHHFGYDTGTYHADGLMAVAYSRIRYVGNSDYERTERQRKVLTGLMSSVKSKSVTELNDLIRDVLPYVTHNIDTGTMLSLTTQAPTYLTYSLEQSRVPFDGMYTTQGEILVPTEPDTINQIQEILNR